MSAEPRKGITVESDVDYHVYPNATAFAVATNGQVSLWAEDKALAVYAPGMWRAAWFTSELEASD